MQKILAQDTLGMFYGPMPVDEFFRFLPVAGDMLDSVRAADFSGVPDYDSNEKQAMYGPLVKEMNKHSTPFQFIFSPSDTSTKNTAKIRPDVCLINPAHLTKPLMVRNVRATTERKRINRPPAIPPLTNSFEWSRCELSCEVKRTADSDAFDDGNISSILDRTTARGSRTRGQLVAYYKEQASRQHRTFIFQIFIFGTFARFLRWDRSGAVVTRKFNYRKEPQLLAGFLWRYSQLDSLCRGWDTTFTLANSADANLCARELKRVLQETPDETASATTKTIHRAVKAMDAEEILHGDYPMYTVDLSPSANWNFGTTIIIRRPLYEPLSPFGRVTRGYLAYDKIHKEFRYFKDTWRIDHRYALPKSSDNDAGGEEPVKQHRSEDEFYTLAKESDIAPSGLPKVYYAGDVKNADGTVQKTDERAPTG